jgi:hypothetical protein
VPECKNRTLEEIDQLFLDGIPVRHFNKVKSVASNSEQASYTSGDAKPAQTQIHEVTHRIEEPE